MKVSLTYIKLKSISRMFEFFKMNSKINEQLKASACLKFKTTGFWKTYYTMTLWNNKEDLSNFNRNGAHLEAMRKSNYLANEIKVKTIEADALPSWKEAKTLLFNLK